MNIFRWLSAPKPVRLILTSVRNLRADLERQGLDPTLLDLVSERASSQIVNSPNAFLKLYTDHQNSPEELSLFAFRLLSGRILASGQFHIYRATLSFHGEELLRIHDYVASEMFRLGFESEENFEKERASLVSAIKSVG